MPEPLIEAKARLRTQLRDRLKNIDRAEAARWSSSISDNLMSPGTITPRNATVALFGGIIGEPDLLPLIPWLVARGGRAVFFGFAHGQLLPQVVTSSDQLHRGIFGVWVPDSSCPVIEPHELNLILVPGLGFDRSGHRLGRGKGHFDRLFAHPGVKARRLAVCYECQVLEAIPIEEHDAAMDALLTEQGLTEVVR